MRSGNILVFKYSTIKTLKKTSNVLFFMLNLITLCSIILIVPIDLFAGPPFLTDDPEPVEYRHFEFYIASQLEITEDSKDITLPHFEVNYGALPNVQIHTIVPFHYISQTPGLKDYGYGDTEFGIKWRFIQQEKYIPMIGTFPLVEIPTGNIDEGLGNGQARYFLPLWIQKNIGKWLSYAGGGYWINLGYDDQNYWSAGWLVQYEFTKMLSIGAEIFYNGISETGAESSTTFNLGAIINFSELHHLLLSAGRDISGPDIFISYLSYQITF